MLRRTARRLRAWLLAPVLQPVKTITHPPASRELQLLLGLQYRQLRHLGASLPQLHDVGFRVYSESDEDGIIHYIFALIGATTKTLVDLGAATLQGSNTANLLINHGWTGLLIDGNEKRVTEIQGLYATSADTGHYPPRCVHAWITAENINELVASSGYTGEIDLLAIDLDGVDYWVWKAIDVVTPRVVVVEYQCIWGPDRSVTVPYRPDFKAVYEGRYGIYNSASLAAFVKLARAKGYRLIGCQRYGYNAFFIRDDIARELLPEVAPRDCFRHPFPLWAMRTLLPKVKHLDWVEV